MAVNPRLIYGEYITGAVGKHSVLEYEASSTGDGAWIRYMSASASFWIFHGASTVIPTTPSTVTPINFSDSTQGGTMRKGEDDAMSSSAVFIANEDASAGGRLFVPAGNFAAISATSTATGTTLLMIVEEV